MSRMKRNRNTFRQEARRTRIASLLTLAERNEKKRLGGGVCMGEVEAFLPFAHSGRRPLGDGSRRPAVRQFRPNAVARQFYDPDDHRLIAELDHNLFSFLAG